MQNTVDNSRSIHCFIVYFQSLDIILKRQFMPAVAVVDDPQVGVSCRQSATSGGIIGRQRCPQAPDQVLQLGHRLNMTLRFDQDGRPAPSGSAVVLADA